MINDTVSPYDNLDSIRDKVIDAKAKMRFNLGQDDYTLPEEDYEAMSSVFIQLNDCIIKLNWLIVNRKD